MVILEAVVCNADEFYCVILSGVSNILSALINMNVEEQNIMNSSHYTTVEFNLPVTETIPASLM